MKRKELILLAALILALGIWALWPKQAGNTVTVTADGREVFTAPIGSSARTPIAEYEDFSLTVVVENGRVWVEDSNCPDLVCQNHAPISKAGEQIVCLPHRLVISITGEEAEVDAFAG